MQIILLTHERELTRASNTGALVLDVTGTRPQLVRRVLWQRTSPDPELLAIIESGHAAVVYPTSEAAGTPTEVVDCETFILLDATWQEARKMFNRSPYLHKVPRVDLESGVASRYVLRRNQKEGCLCTAECVMEILRGKGYTDMAEEIEARFLQFNTRGG